MKHISEIHSFNQISGYKFPIVCCDDDDYESVANTICHYYDVNVDATGSTTKGKVIIDADCDNVRESSSHCHWVLKGVSSGIQADAEHEAPKLPPNR